MGGKGSGGRRVGAGRKPKLGAADRFIVEDLCDSLAHKEFDNALSNAHKKFRPEYTRQMEQATAGEDGMTLEERAARRQQWLRMPVGRGHKERVANALREDQGLDEHEQPSSSPTSKFA